MATSPTSPPTSPSKAAPSSKVPEIDEDKRSARRKHNGYIHMKLWFDVADAALVCKISEARDLAPFDRIAKCEPYVKMYLLPDSGKKSKRKTTIKKRTVNPIFDEELRWKITNFEEHSGRLLQVSVWDKAASSKKDFLGRMSIKLGEIPAEGVTGWFELFDPERGKFDYSIASLPAGAGQFIAMYDHVPGCEKELYIRAGDPLDVVKQANDWSLVQHAITRNRGYVPASFIAASSSVESEPWFFGRIGRGKAEKLLRNPEAKHGAFLIRESETTAGQYSLSMKDGDSIRHFRVVSQDGGYKLQGSPSAAFPTLQDMVKHHMQKRSGLTTTLREPCPKEQRAKAPDLSYDHKDKWEVPRESIELMGVLGQGQFGEVYRGRWNGTTDVAVKTLKSATSNAKEFLEEASVMKNLQHDHLVQLYAVCSVGEPILIVLELMTKGCLLDYLQTKEGEALRLPALLDMAAGVAAGMAYLESKNCIHRDLAARNILVGDNNVCKISDFGFARLVQDAEYKPENLERFPVRWTAPEAMAHNRYSIKSDVWSFGVLLTEIITYGRKPYQGLTNKEVVAKLESGYRMPCPPGCPPELYNLMLDCWKAVPGERPTFHVLQFQLQDFFYSGEHNYAELSKVLD
eukprot:m.165541 g.165541  ORF g.165541 m.165541 type:complete len:630 (+) comp17160_c0_seq3:480-2369(+)